MATIGLRKIYTFDNIGVGQSGLCRWNVSDGHVYHYFAYAVVATPAGPHSSKHGQVSVSKVENYRLRDNDDGDKLQNLITVTNTGDQACGAELWQSWVES